jgi:hypothetical protein
MIPDRHHAEPGCTIRTFKARKRRIAEKEADNCEGFA